MPAIALPPSRRMAIALAVFRMRASILAPVVAVALCPRALGPGLVLAVVGIALPLCLLPTATSPALTVRSTAIHLMRDLWTRPECLAAARTPPVLHGGLSAQGNLSEAHPAPDAYNLDGEPNPANPRRLHRPYDDGALTRPVQSGLSTPTMWGVHSSEHTRVNSRERQGISRFLWYFAANKNNVIYKFHHDV